MSASKPPITQTPIAGMNSGIFSATAAGFLNTPEPMTVPITTAAVIHGPRTRGRAESVGFVLVTMGDSLQDCARFPRGILAETAGNVRYRKGQRGGDNVFSDFW